MYRRRVVIELGDYRYDIRYQSLVIAVLDFEVKKPDSVMVVAEQALDQGADVLEIRSSFATGEPAELNSALIELHSMLARFEAPISLRVIDTSQINFAEDLFDLWYIAEGANQMVSTNASVITGDPSPVLVSDCQSELTLAELVALQTKHIFAGARLLRSKLPASSRRVADISAAILQSQRELI